MDSDLANTVNSGGIEDVQDATDVINVDAPERETRVYSTRRLRSFHGYRGEPVVEDILDFQLPRIRFYHSRVVVLRGRPHLIWSPNSLQNPFYPGIYLYHGRIVLPVDLVQRRYDGQGGISDFTQVPQVYQADRPWLGFVYRPSRAPTDDVEYAPAYSVWDNPVGLEVNGRIRPAYAQRLRARNSALNEEIRVRIDRIRAVRPNLLAKRPQRPYTGEIDELARERRFERAVDLLAAIQRDVREKDAWLTFAEILLMDMRPPAANDEIFQADDRFMGTWINGALEDDCLWFLCKAALPCFVIHQLPSESKIPEDACRNMYVRTDVEPMLATTMASEFDRLAMGREFRYTTAEFHPVEPVSPRNREHAPKWSSLWKQLGKPEGEDIPRTVPYRPRPIPDREELKKRLEIIGDLPSLVNHVVGLKYLSDTSSLEEAMQTGTRPDDDVDYSSWALVNIDPERLPWMRPPAIESVTAGKWTTFRESSKEDGKTFMKEIGKGNSERNMQEGDVCFYDRILRYRLIFSGPPPMESHYGFTTSIEYGRPVPDWEFAFRTDGGVYYRRNKSRWMYSQEKPEVAYRGRVADAPPAHLLPRRDNGQHESNEGGWVERGDDDDDMDVDTTESSRPPEAPIPGPSSRVLQTRFHAPPVLLRLRKEPPVVPHADPPVAPPRLSPTPAPTMTNSLASASVRPMTHWTPQFRPAPRVNDNGWPRESVPLPIAQPRRPVIGPPIPPPRSLPETPPAPRPVIDAPANFTPQGSEGEGADSTEIRGPSSRCVK
ncbi:hypothetical protein C8R46DRAFT_1036368 [Mycena filopes]|nr:hypothetical protein C8R46DRAFT_1036368 [Mycena filopes]